MEELLITTPGQLLCVDVYYLRRHLMHRSLYHARSLNRDRLWVYGPYLVL